MAAPTIYEDVIEGVDVEKGQLFSGKSFYVLQRVPSRNRYLDLIKSNGGRVVLVDKQADYVIADHFKPRHCPPGSISYKFIEDSIKAGEIQDPEKHRAGPPLGTVRQSGSTTRPAKNLRAQYTAEEDAVLYKWVRDHEAQGMLSGGNEMYKRLEIKYPQHTWQSWRDHYLKHLRYRAPPTSNILDNTPPSAPKDKSTTSRPVSNASEPVKTPTVQEEGGSSRPTVPATDEELVPLEKLERMFTKDEWEELYAAKEHIESIDEEEYKYGWEKLAETKPQSADMWRQYFERVVRPQWNSDAPSKREQIKAKIYRKIADNDRQESTQENNTQMDENERPSLPLTTIQKGKRKLVVEEEEQTEIYKDQSHGKKNKRPKAVSPLSEEDDEPITQSIEEAQIIGTMHQPQEISSRASSPIGENLMDENLEGTTYVQPQTPIKEMQSRNDRRALEPLPPPSIKVDVESLHSSDYPSNTPTPRAPRHKVPAPRLDTQAPLSSPLQDSLHINPLPPSLRINLEDDESNQSPKNDSDNVAAAAAADDEDDEDELFVPQDLPSDTYSMQEFRRSLNDNDSQPQKDTLAPNPLTLPAPTSSTPSTPHTETETDDPDPDPDDPETDPDPPLTASEITTFFTELGQQGYSNTWITTALKCTRCRPELAAEVLEAWRLGKKLPDKRGVWSKEDDEDVEGGDARALERLGWKHGVDGWGGVVERMGFLKQLREG